MLISAMVVRKSVLLAMCHAGAQFYSDCVGVAGFPCKAQVANAGRALHMLLNKDEMAALKKKSEAEEASSPGGKATDFAGSTPTRAILSCMRQLTEACGNLRKSLEWLAG